MGMSRAYAFTTAAMAAALEETPVTYEDLAEIERDFDDAETEIIRQQVHLTLPLYARRALTVSQIPNFWPLVLEQAPPDIDQFIQPSDSALLLSSLIALDVSHFQLASTATANKTQITAAPTLEPELGADPRSVAIRFEFSPNEYFTDTVLEKKFYYRRASNGWAGLVSEPVRIHWKKGRDLTGGLLDLVCRAWEEEKTAPEEGEARAAEKATKPPGQLKGKVTPSTAAAPAEKRHGITEAQKALRRKIEHTGMGGLSFFAWFGFIGRRVSAAESAAATAVESQRRERRRKGVNSNTTRMDENVNGHGTEDDDDEDEDLGMSLEIFPDGDDLAVAITEDLWPGAIKYFTQAQEQDALSDADFESDDDEDDDDNERDMASHLSGGDGSPPAKKRRT